MSYATQQDLIDRFGETELVELTDKGTPPTGVVDPTVVARALADADAAIDGYVRKRYALPLDSVPAMVVQVACDLARYFLHEDAATEAVRRRRDEAMAFLKDLAAGRAELDVAGKAPAASGNSVRTASQDRLFDRSKMGGF